MTPLNLFIPISSLGYGTHSMGMVKGFVDNNIDISINTIGQTQIDPYYNKTLENIYGNYSLFNRNSPSVCIFHSEHATNFTGSPTVSFCVFETTKISDQALYNVKNVVDLVFTTTEVHKNLLIEQGIDSNKIYVVNEGVDPLLYNSDSSGKLINTGKFTFITSGKKEERKNTDLILRSFITSMQYNEAALICHTFNPFCKNNQYTDVNLESYGFNKKTGTSTYELYSNGMCDIYFTRPLDSQTMMRSLYRSANVGIAVSRAEGWDRCLHELMACGVPCIASDVIGHSEYLPGSPKIQQDLIIKPTGMEIANDGVWFNGNQGEWPIIDMDDVIDKIEHVYDNKNKYNHVSHELSTFYTTKFDWTRPVLEIKEILSL